MNREKMNPAEEPSTEIQDAHFDQISPVQEFIQDQNNCCLCGSELKFTHKFDHLELTVLEDAKCESCHISLRTRSHSLQ